MRREERIAQLAETYMIEWVSAGVVKPCVERSASTEVLESERIQARADVASAFVLGEEMVAALERLNVFEDDIVRVAGFERGLEAACGVCHRVECVCTRRRLESEGQ